MQPVVLMQLAAGPAGTALAQQRARALDRHQAAENPEQHDVAQRNRQLDLAEPPEQENSHTPTTEPASPPSSRIKPILKSTLPRRQWAMHPGQRSADQLVGRGGHRNGGRHADEDQQRSQQKPAADPEHPRQKPDRRAEPQQDENVQRHLGDRQVDIHASDRTGPFLRIGTAPLAKRAACRPEPTTRVPPGKAPKAGRSPFSRPQQPGDVLDLAQDRRRDRRRALGAVAQHARRYGRDRPSAAASRRRSGRARRRQAPDSASLKVEKFLPGEARQRRFARRGRRARHRCRRDCRPRAALRARRWCPGSGSGSVLARRIFSAIASASSVMLMRE